MRYYLLLIIPLLFVGCKKDATETALNNTKFAYLGGEIINPNKDYVVIYKPNTIVDTAFLDENNRFSFKVENLQPGIYFFKHKPENQIVFLEPNDSLMLRLNTLEFDESLVYTGKGAKKNNYLTDLFLENERNNKSLLDYCQLLPEAFESKLDSIRNRQLKKLKVFENKAHTSELFNEIAKAKINYNYYANKEIYPFAYYGENEIKNLSTLPKDFYNYRDSVDYNNEKLRSFFQYYRFLETHFNNIALNNYFKHAKDSVFNSNSLKYNLVKLNLIDSLVKNDSIKNDLLKYSARTYFYKSKSNKNTEVMLNAYLKKSTSENDKKHAKLLAKSLMTLEPGTKLPEVTVLNYKNKKVNLNTTINKPTVIYFWSEEMKGHFKDSHKKIRELRVKYPEISFIAVNISDDTTGVWKRYLQKYSFPLENEYKFTEPNTAKKALVISNMYKVMIVDSEAKIAEHDTNMYSPKFEELLLGLLNK